MQAEAVVSESDESNTVFGFFWELHVKHLLIKKKIDILVERGNSDSALQTDLRHEQISGIRNKLCQNS